MQGLLEHTRRELEDQRKRAAMWQDECNSILAKYGSDDQKALQEARAQCESLQKEVDTLKRASEAWNRERAQLQKVRTRPLGCCCVPPAWVGPSRAVCSVPRCLSQLRGVGHTRQASSAHAEHLQLGAGAAHSTQHRHYRFCINI